MSNSLWPHGLQPARLLCPWNLPGKKNTGAGCHFILQGIFPTHWFTLGLWCLLHWQTGSLSLVPPGKPSNQYICIYIRHVQKQIRYGVGVDFSLLSFLPLETSKNLQAKFCLGPAQTLFYSPSVSSITSLLHPTAVIILGDPQQTTLD